MQFLFTAPINRPLGDVTITGIRVNTILMDLDAGTVTAICQPIEDGPGLKAKVVVINLTPTQVTNFTASLKNAIANSLGVTFQ